MPYPIGIQDFENIRRDSYVYVDKTALVYKLATSGKSLNKMCRSFFTLLALALAAALLNACASRHTAAALNDVESYIQERPDSALATLRAIDTTTLTTRKLRAQHALLHAIALDKNWIDTADVNVVMPAVEYYDRHPSGIRRAKAWYYLGRILENSKDFAPAGIAFLKAEKYSEQTNDLHFKSLVYQSLSNNYNETHLYEEALRYTTLSYELSVQDGDTLGANASLYRMAQDLNNVGRYAESDSLYRLLIEDGQVHPNLRASLLCNYALNLVTRHEDFDNAIPIFEEVISSTGSLGSANFWGAYAYALTRKGAAEKADRIFSQLASIKDNSTVAYIYDSWKSMADAFEGAYADAYQLQKSAAGIQNENVKKVLQQSAIKAQKDFLEQIHQEAEKSARRKQFVAWSLLALLLAVLLLLFYLFKRLKERSAQVDRIESEKASVRNKYIQLCQSHFGRIGRVNEVLYHHSREKDNELYKELKRSIRNIGMDNKKQSEFELLLDEAFDNVMVHFRDSFPDKKPQNYQLVSFLFAGFDSSTICAAIPGFKKQNVHVEKYRLKQMIKDSDSQYKEQFLELLS